MSFRICFQKIKKKYKNHVYTVINPDSTGATITPSNILDVGCFRVFFVIFRVLGVTDFSPIIFFDRLKITENFLRAGSYRAPWRSNKEVLGVIDHVCPKMCG